MKMLFSNKSDVDLIHSLEMLIKNLNKRLRREVTVLKVLLIPTYQKMNSLYFYNYIVMYDNIMILRHLEFIVFQL